MTLPEDPHRWTRIADLFDRALSVRVDDRSAWLVAICGDDVALHDEVESLLRVHDRAGSFISHPATLSGPPDAATVPVPSLPIGPYRVHRVLGAGGMGVVYLAEDIRLGRDVALKMVAPTAAHDGDRVARLRREARVAASLTHPNIATVFALEEIDGHLFMVSEYVAGDTLRDELQRGPLPVAKAIETMTAVVAALAAAHSRGIVHRDLKPENIVRTADGVIKVLDFGLAVNLDGPAASLTADGAALGTPAYMSPEQIRGGPIDARSDHFALGILFYELLTGVHPFLARTAAATLARILEDVPDPLRVPSPAAAENDVQIEHLNGLVMRCLQKRADQRYADTPALGAALVRITAPARPPSRPRARRPDALWWWQFHQAAATSSYLVLLIPLWVLRHLTGASMGLFQLALAAAVGAGALRLHLWFTSRQYPDQWLQQHTRARRWLRAADVVFAAALLAVGLLAAGADHAAAPLLVAAAVGVGVAFLVVEPATTRAAHGRRTRASTRAN